MPISPLQKCIYSFSYSFHYGLSQDIEYRFLCIKFYSSQIESYNPGTASHKAPRTVMPIRHQNTVTWASETKGCALNDLNSLQNPDL